MIEASETIYQLWIERHVGAVLASVRYAITRLADEAVEVAARAVALAAPLPNAINMYQVAVGQLGWGQASALAFALTLEIVVFLLVEVSLRLWDGYLTSPRRYRVMFGVSIVVVAVAAIVVMTIVFALETHKIMSLLPVVSLCSFVGIGLKRWDERGHEGVKSSVKRSVKSSVKFDTTEAEDFTPSKADERRQELLSRLSEYDGLPVGDINKSALAKAFSVSRPTIISDIVALQDAGKLTLNGHVKINK